jgi:zinc ribbon protein
MAIIQCPECSKEISDSAFTCPHCGYPKYLSAIKILCKTAQDNALKYLNIILKYLKAFMDSANK